MQLLRKILDFSESALAVICVLAFVVMFVLGVATVVFRFLLESSLAFPDELIRYLFVWMIFLGSAIALRRNLHAAIGVFVERLPDRPRRAMLILATLASALFFLTLIIKGLELTIRAGPQISPALEVSMAWVYAAIPVGGVFLLIYAIELLAGQMQAPAPEPDAMIGGN